LAKLDVTLPQMSLAEWGEDADLLALLGAVTHGTEVHPWRLLPKVEGRRASYIQAVFWFL
jgi:hypothetical protein